MTKLEKIAKECFEKQINPEESEFECFFHYTDEKLFEAGFKKGYEHAIQSQLVEMDNVLELIKDKKEQYREFRRQLRHESTTAKRLGFNTEVQKIEIDRKWTMEIIDLLEKVAIKVQSSSNSG